MLFNSMCLLNYLRCKYIKADFIAQTLGHCFRKCKVVFRIFAIEKKNRTLFDEFR